MSISNRQQASVMSVLPTDLHALLGSAASDERIAKFVGHAEPDSIKVYSGSQNDDV